MKNIQLKPDFKYLIRGKLIPLFLILFISLDPEIIIAQKSASGTDLEKLLEQLDSEELGSDPEQLIENLHQLIANPVNINRAGMDELLEIPFMSLSVAKNVVEFRSENGVFTSLNDLIQVQGIGNKTLENLSPFLTIGSASEKVKDFYLNPTYWKKNLQFETISRYQRTLQTREGFFRTPGEGGYTGDTGKYYQRFRVRSDHLSLNLTQEKDPGEPANIPAGFDYSSWHIALTDNGIFENVVVGDYSVSFGQGLILWNGSSFGKSRDVTRSPVKNGSGIRPYTSSQETNAFRGIALSAGEKIQFSAFYSNRLRTASEIDRQTVRFPSETGLHRTLTERSRKNNLAQKTFGGRVRLQLPFGFAAINSYQNKFNKPIDPGLQPHQIYRFRGKSLRAYSVDYQFLFNSFHLFGEAGMTDNQAAGFISGVKIKPVVNYEMILVYRNYDIKFQSILGSGFGEQSGLPQNEEGLYIGLKYGINSQIDVSGYFDQFRFQAPRFGTRKGTTGYDFLVSTEFAATRRFSLYVLGRSKIREDEFASLDNLGRDIRQTGTERRSGVRFNLSYWAAPSVRLQSRIEWVQSRSADNETSDGYLLYQDIRLIPSPNLRIDARITLFDTDNFQSRIFQFESDLLYVFSNRALFDQGQRMYITVKYNIFNKLEIWGKISTTLFENRQAIGSGLDEIHGKRQSDIGIQTRVRF